MSVQVVISNGDGTNEYWDLDKWAENVHNRLSYLEQEHPVRNGNVEGGSATPQPVRIRPEDMVMVYRDDKEPEQVKLSRINWECAHITHISPIQPVGRKWMTQRTTVWMRRDTGQIEKGTVFSAIKDWCSFTPVLSPDEPAPAGPEANK